MRGDTVGDWLFLSTVTYSHEIVKQVENNDGGSETKGQFNIRYDEFAQIPLLAVASNGLGLGERGIEQTS